MTSIPFKSNVANSLFPTSSQFVAGGISNATVPNANPTMVFTSSSVPKGSKSPSSNTASLDSINWTNSYGKAAPQTAMTSSTANVDSFTMGMNSKTRNLSANTTVVSSKVSSDTENRTISPAVMTTVPLESVEHMVHRDASQRNTPTMQVPRLPPYSLQPQQQPQPQPQQPPQQKFNSAMDGLSFDSPNQVNYIFYILSIWKLHFSNSVYLFYRFPRIITKATLEIHYFLLHLSLWRAVFQTLLSELQL